MTDKELIARLFSEGKTAERAWNKFLKKYSNLMLKIIWQFDKDYDQVMDKYLYICKRLSANDFAILRKYDPGDRTYPPKFSTWLFVVVRNLCVESYRARHGRRRIPKTIAQLTDFHRKIFELYYWKGHSVDEIVQLQGGSPVHNRSDILDALEHIESVLSDVHSPVRAQWDKPKFIPYDDESLKNSVESIEQEKAVELTQWIEHIMESLSHREQAVIRLRYWEDMTAKEIAHLLGIRPVRKVYRILEKGVRRMRETVKDENRR